MAGRKRVRIDRWQATRLLLAPELARYRARWPESRRRLALEAIDAAATAEDADGLSRGGLSYLALTGVVPPGCYAQCPNRPPHFFLAGERIAGSRRRETWEVRHYSVQVWR